MRGCLSLIAWTPASLMMVGPFLEYENPAFSNYEGAPEPSLWPTPDEALALALWGLFWLAGLALLLTLGHLWRSARDDADVEGLATLTIALIWALLVSWLTVGIEPLLFPDPEHFHHEQLWGWSIDNSVEFVFLPSFAILLWCGGLATMLLAVRSVWRWLPAE
ncbi:MAG: hypothetical protein M3439_04295 [Chloroflexota bacterium]|nr:hypothetical protein [Chloroflexota bacterium]